MADTDPLTAQLEQAWGLLDDGDPEGAAEIARNAAIDPIPAELSTLLGAIAAELGEPAEALEHFQRAMQSNPESAAPVLQSAELLLYSLGNPTEALKLAHRAAEIVLEDDQLADAVLLTAEAHHALGDAAAALSALEELTGVCLHNAAVHERAGGLLTDLGAPGRARQHFESAAALDPDSGDAYYGLGLACEALGERRAMLAAYLHARSLDLAAPPAPWHLEAEEFHQLAENAFQQLPKRAQTLLANVPILVAQYPAAELVAEGNDPRMLGFFTGVPLPDKQSVEGSDAGPDCVFLYQRNIENSCAGPDELAREIAITLWHETAHYFGLDDQQLAEIGLG